MGVPSMAALPAVMLCSPVRHFNRVVLPMPEGPTMQHTSPACTSKVRSAITGTGPAFVSYDFARPCTLRRTGAVTVVVVMRSSPVAGRRCTSAARGAGRG